MTVQEIIERQAASIRELSPGNLCRSELARASGTLRPLDDDRARAARIVDRSRPVALAWQRAARLLRLWAMLEWPAGSAFSRISRARL